MNAATQAPLFASPRIEFFAAGEPTTKGSMRAFVVPGKFGGKPRAVMFNDTHKNAKAWAAVISEAALDAIGGPSVPPLEGPLEVTVVFRLQRPKSHSTSKGLRANAPIFVSKKPDADKLARCALDALTGVVFVDDSQIARLIVEKRYAAGSTGAQFVIEKLT